MSKASPSPRPPTPTTRGSASRRSASSTPVNRIDATCSPVSRSRSGSASKPPELVADAVLGSRGARHRRRRAVRGGHRDARCTAAAARRRRRGRVQHRQPAAARRCVPDLDPAEGSPRRPPARLPRGSGRLRGRQPDRSGGSILLPVSVETVEPVTHQRPRPQRGRATMTDEMVERVRAHEEIGSPPTPSAQVAGAGTVRSTSNGPVQVMHPPAVLVVERCHDGDWMTGDHPRFWAAITTPQEEVVFHAIVERLAADTPAPVMIELGAVWAYYVPRAPAAGAGDVGPSWSSPNPTPRRRAVATVLGRASTSRRVERRARRRWARRRRSSRCRFPCESDAPGRGRYADREPSRAAGSSGFEMRPCIDLLRARRRRGRARRARRAPASSGRSASGSCWCPPTTTSSPGIRRPTSAAVASLQDRGAHSWPSTPWPTSYAATA